jgi:hypothetical protein
MLDVLAIPQVDPDLPINSARVAVTSQQHTFACTRCCVWVLVLC